MEVHSKHRIWLEIDGAKFMGKGHVQLLRAIQKTGSLNKAAKETGISYRKSWRLIHQVNTMAAHELVQLQKGGAGGGGAMVTSYGEKLLSFFENLMDTTTVHLDNELKKANDLWD